MFSYDRCALALASFLCAAVGDVGAQDRATLRAAPSAAVSVDGELREVEWAQADVASDFLQLQPSEGAPASQRSEIRVLYGSASLYVGAFLHDSEPAAIEPTLGRRDEFNRADWFVVSIDAYLDRRTAYAFAVNAAGVQFDGVYGSGGDGPGNDGPDGVDSSWDGIWDSAVGRTAEGWVVEMEIPYSMLRFRRAPTQTWGIQFARHLPRSGEISEWPLVPLAERSNQLARFADLTGMAGIEPRRNLRVSPYTVARMEETDPANGVTERDVEVGTDLKVGFGPNITLDATVNPDFGQVESDPAVLNLTAFETIFEERRPFFLEGSSIYDFQVGPGSLLYTRRIGADAPIIGAGKLSGRSASGLSFGVLGAATGEDFEPSRNFGVARVIQQFSGNSTAGGMVTLYDARDSTRSLNAGADWDLRFADDRFGVEGFVATTNRSGAEEENGFAAKLWGVKRQGDWQGFAGVEVFSDHFDPNDLGQLRVNDAYVAIGEIQHQLNGNRPFGPFQRASAELFAVQRYSYRDGLNQGLSLELGSNWELRGFQEIEIGVELEDPFGGYDLYETRGAGPWRSPRVASISAEISTDRRRSWQVEPEVFLGATDRGGRAFGTGLRGNWRVSDRITLEGNLNSYRESGVEAWSANETFARSPDGGWLIGADSAVAFDDGGQLDAILPGDLARYTVPVFGDRDTRSVDLTLRGGYTFTPRLSLQLYGQLLLAGGRYRNMKILVDPDENAPFPAYPKRNEFALSSAQSNTVLRWEFRRGSALYLVWTHGRNAEDALNPLGPWGASPYERSLGGQLGDTWELLGEDVLLLKVSYAFLN